MLDISLSRPRRPAKTCHNPAHRMQALGCLSQNCLVLPAQGKPHEPAMCGVQTAYVKPLAGSLFASPRQARQPTNMLERRSVETGDGLRSARGNLEKHARPWARHAANTATQCGFYHLGAAFWRSIGLTGPDWTHQCAANASGKPQNKLAASTLMPKT